MNKIQQLIQQYCPNGVEFKELGEVCLSVNAGGDLPENYKKGQVLPTNEFPYPIYSNGCDDNALYGFTDKYKIDSDAITISARGTIGYHTIREAKYTPIVRLISLIPNKELITTKFLNYILDMTPIGGTNGGIPQLTVPTVKKISIPLPPFPIQQEIVTVLDTFTALDASLQTELEARKNQYEHYRNQLLNFEGKEVEWKTLGEVCDVRDGTHDSPKQSADGKFLVTSKNLKNNNIDLSSSYLISEYDYNQVNKRSKVDKWDILISMIGTVGEVAVIKTEPKFAIKNVGLIKVGNELLSKYIAFYLNGPDAKLYMVSTQNGSAQKFLSLSMLRNFPIPIPPLTEQERIVSILDKFDALVNNELPAEIAARRKQYEYYREKLLDFKTLQT